MKGSVLCQRFSKIKVEGSVGIPTHGIIVFCSEKKKENIIVIRCQTSTAVLLRVGATTLAADDEVFHGDLAPSPLKSHQPSWSKNSMRLRAKSTQLVFFLSLKYRCIKSMCHYLQVHVQMPFLCVKCSLFTLRRQALPSTYECGESVASEDKSRARRTREVK